MRLGSALTWNRRPAGLSPAPALGGACLALQDPPVGRRWFCGACRRSGITDSPLSNGHCNAAERGGVAENGVSDAQQSETYVQPPRRHVRAPRPDRSAPP